MKQNISIQNLEAFKYIILPGKCELSPSYLDLYNQAYSYWKSFWSEIYSEEDSVFADNFLRQDFIAIVLYQNKIVAMHLYTIFNIHASLTRHHSYFKTYPALFLEHLIKNNVKNVMSIEYLTVSPEWRKSLTGISFGEIMIGTSLKYLHHLKIDAAIALTRNDRKVNTLCYNFGFEYFASGLYGSFEVDFIVGFRDKVYANRNAQIEQIISYFWQNRIDYTQRLTGL